MELEVRDSNRQRNYKAIRYIAIALLIPLLALFFARFEYINKLLLNINKNGVFLPIAWWVIIVKFTSYCIQILLNFCLLFAITNRFRYSLFMVYIAFIILFTGILITALRDITGVQIPITVIAFFVKLNKSLILLVIFIAGHIASNQIQKKNTPE